MIAEFLGKTRFIMLPCAVEKARMVRKREQVYGQQEQNASLPCRCGLCQEGVLRTVGSTGHKVHLPSLLPMHLGVARGHIDLETDDAIQELTVPGSGFLRLPTSGCVHSSLIRHPEMEIPANHSRSCRTELVHGSNRKGGGRTSCRNSQTLDNSSHKM